MSTTLHQMFRRLVLIFVAGGVIALQLCISAAVLAEEVVFKDIPVTHPNFKAITFLKEQGFISGYEDGTFLPERTVTRAELVKISLLGSGITPRTDFQINFTDVPADAWFAPFVAEARDRGIVSGYEDGTFRPDQTVTRVEGLKILLNTKGVVIPQNSIPAFQDVPSDSWFAGYVQYVVDHRLLEISGPVFDTDAGLKRKDVAQILYTMLIAERASELTPFPLSMILIWIGVWLLLGAWGAHEIRHEHQFFKKMGPWIWCLSVLGPFVLLGVRVMRLRRPPSTTVDKEDEDTFFHPDREGLDTKRMRRQVYFKRPRKIGREILNVIDVNWKPLLQIALTLGMLWILWGAVDISLNTFEYQKSFAPITDK